MTPAGLGRGSDVPTGLAVAQLHLPVPGWTGKGLGVQGVGTGALEEPCAHGEGSWGCLRPLPCPWWLW